MADSNFTPESVPVLPAKPSDVSSLDGLTESVKRRPVYEPTLLPPRNRIRVSPWIVIPGLLLLCAALLYALVLGPHKRRFLPTAGKIVFASDQGTPGHTHIWIANSDGSGARRLITGTADETSPFWSPDGNQITFLSARAGSDPQVYIADADGQNLLQITHSGGGKSQPQFAPSDNTLIGYLSGGGFNIVDTTTGQLSRLLPVVKDNHGTSPDGLQQPTQVTPILAFAWSQTKERTQQSVAAVEDVNGIQALVILPTLTGQPRDTRDGTTGSPPLAAANGLWLAWSPDGAVLALALQDIAGLPAGRHGSGLVTFDSQGNPTGQRPLFFLPDAAVSPQTPIISPDGAQLVFELWRGNDPARRYSVGLFGVPLDGSAPPRELVRGPVTNVHFSSDGQYLFFLRRRADGGHDLCRAAADGSGFQRLSDGQADVTDAAVSPQTSHL